MKTFASIFGVLSACVAMTSAYAGDSTKKQLQEIAENAEVANGSTDLKAYDARTFKLVTALNKDLKIVKKDHPDCGPYLTTQSRRETIDALRKYSDDDVTADALNTLYKDKKIFKMYSIRLNNDIDCSRMWVEVFTTDGNVLELYYGLND